MLQKIYSLSLSLSLSPSLSLLDESYRATFQRAIEAWEEATCIEFELAENGEVDHLVFIKSEDLG